MEMNKINLITIMRGVRTCSNHLLWEHYPSVGGLSSKTLFPLCTGTAVSGIMQQTQCVFPFFLICISLFVANKLPVQCK